MSDQPKPETGGNDEAHRLFEPEDEPNIISHSTPTQPKPTGEWTVESVKRSDGTLWPGLAYIAQSNGTVFGSFNEQQAIHLVAAIQAERDKQDAIVIKQGAAVEARDTTIQQLREQLAAAVEDTKRIDWLDETQALCDDGDGKPFYQEWTVRASENYRGVRAAIDAALAKRSSCSQR